MYVDLINELVEEIIKNSQNYAKEAGITQGAVVVSFRLLSEEARKEYRTPLVRNGELVLSEPIVKGDEDTFYRIEGKPEGDCAEVAKQKIASARRAFLYYLKREPFFPESLQSYMSESLPEELAGNGRTTWKGGTYIPVGFPMRQGCALLWGNDEFDIGFAISGGTQEQDKDVILKVLPVIRAIIRKYGLLIPKAFP
jgi:hypothetical protein